MNTSLNKLGQRGLLLSALLILSGAQAQTVTQPGGRSTTGGVLPLVSVGLTWPQAQQSYVIVVTPENAGRPLGLEVYSPTLNLADYADFRGQKQRGPNYFGDELYSQNQNYQTTFSLTGPDGAVFERSFGSNREHTWESLFNGGLAAGTYTLKVTSQGNGKNSFALRVSSPFTLATSDFSVNARDTERAPLLAARLNVPAAWVGQTVSILNYDIDGPQEAESWVVMPGNRRTNLTTSENGKTATDRFTVTADMVGEWQVYIRVLPTTKQFSNAISYSFRLGNRPTAAVIGGFETPTNALIANRLVVDVVDTQGNRIPSASYVVVGDTTVKPTLPSGYTPVSGTVVEGKGTVVSPSEVRFQPGNNRIRFVARRPNLVVDVVDTQGNPIPGSNFTAQNGVARPSLPDGYVPVSATVIEGRGTVNSPTQVTYQPGDTRIRFVARRPGIVVDVVDTAGRPIQNASYVAEGGLARPVLPQGYVPVSGNLIEGRGTVVSPTEVTYQNTTDVRIRFVARQPRLVVDVVDTEGRPIQGSNYTAQNGVASPVLPQNYVPVSGNLLEGRGTVVSPTQVNYGQDDTTIRFVARLQRLAVDIVDTQGQPIEGARYDVQGNVVTPTLPRGYEPVSATIVEGQGTTPSPTEARFQPGDTRIRFVARLPLGQLAVDAVAVIGDQRIALPGVPFQVNGQVLNTPTTVPLNPGDYPVLPTAIQGSTFTTPAPGRVIDGQTGRVTIEYRIQTEISLNVAPDLLGPCDVTQLGATAKTTFPYRVPARLRLNLPAGWTSDYPLSLAGDFGGGQELRLKAPVRVCRSDVAQAVLEPSGLSTSGAATVRAPGGANASRNVENGARASVTKTLDPTGQGYTVTLTLTVDRAVDNLRIIDPLPSGTNPSVRSALAVNGSGTVGASTDGDTIVLGRVAPGTYRITYTLFTDAPADRVVTAPELTW